MAALQSIANKALKSVYLSNTQGASSALKKAALALQADSLNSLFGAKLFIIAFRIAVTNEELRQQRPRNQWNLPCGRGRV